MKPQIFTLHNQILEATLPEAAFPFLVDGKKHTIALVGGGGRREGGAERHVAERQRLCISLEILMKNRMFQR